MSAAASPGTALYRRFLEAYPHEAALELETLPAEEASAVVSGEPADTVVAVLDHLAPGTVLRILAHLPATERSGLLHAMEPARAARLLRHLDVEARTAYLAELPAAITRELASLLSYPPDSAGQWMDPRILPLGRWSTVGDTLRRIRGLPSGSIATLFLVDPEDKLDGRVDLQDLAVADPSESLAALARPVPVSVSEFAPREELVARFEEGQLASLPVLDYAGRLTGVVHQSALVSAVQEEASADLQAMVGVSREERALSSVRFSVTRRLPWMVINLATAFLAAAVVGLFEGLIGRFTALAVLLPVVAGQSGNAGAQALAITIRGLALHEITVRHWVRVVFKEMRVGLLNGLAVAVICAFGVYLWSGSAGLGLIIGLAMVLAMVAAGISGALVPITLTRLGQDPAQASSIILTTVTDVVGFAGFLGTATVLAHLI
ncbi:magnesium transporter [Thiohalorhabdus sp.]|uniref:magnesium transporter n=1 Tax=Thiohalorhabdus sp. TaxID=3094134 RepID=UPI002FC35220